MTSDKDTSGGMESVKSDEVGDYEMWTEETVDIETPFSNVCQDDVEYLKLEIAELKQILIALAEKYKLSEDRRKVAERRNSFLKADNLRLQQISDQSLSQKIEAEIDNRRTLDKLREFIDFKHEFEKQAELLKKIISHLPKMKNVATSTSCSMLIEKSEQCSGDFDIDQIFNSDEIKIPSIDKQIIINNVEISASENIIDEINQNYNNETTLDIEKYFNEDPSKDYNNLQENIIINTETIAEPLQDILLQLSESNYRDVTDKNDDDEDEIEYEVKVRSWDPKPKECVTAESISSGDIMKNAKSKTALGKLKQEILSLKNMNDWKSSDLEYKNRQLTVKNRELSQAKKEITKLKMQINKMMVEQQKRPQTSFVTPVQSNKPEQSSVKKTEKVKEDANQGRMRQESKTKQLQSKSKSIMDDEKQNKSQTSMLQSVKSEKLPISTESVWREIAPGDQVRIKLKKGFPDK